MEVDKGGRSPVAIQNLLLFFLLFTALAMITAWLQENYYINDLALKLFAKVSAVLDSPKIRLENIGLIYPPIPYFLLLPFFFVPGLSPAITPYLVSVLIGTFLLMLWNHHLTERQLSFRCRIALILLAASHPYFLIAITTGVVQDALSLVLFYFLYYTTARFTGLQDIRSFIMLGTVLASYFFVDERAAFLFIALLPLLPLIAPRRLMDDSAVSFYTVSTFPFLLSLVSWVFLNWIFHNNPWLFLQSPETSFRGGWFITPEVSWLRVYGGSWFRPVVISSVLLFTAYPSLLWVLYQARKQLILFTTSLVLYLHPIIAIGFATHRYFITHPSNILFLLGGGIMAGVIMLPPLTSAGRKSMLFFFLLSAIGGWLTLGWIPSPEITYWKNAMLGQKQDQFFTADIQLGLWLRKHHTQTLMDERSGYRAIAARGDAKELMLSFSEQFKRQLKQTPPEAPLVVLPDPSTRLGKIDRINLRFPNFYKSGATGYNLVYDADAWRVYQKDTETVYN